MKPLLVSMCVALLILAAGIHRSLANMQEQRAMLLSQADSLLVLGSES